MVAPLIPVSGSSNVAAAGYDLASQTLSIMFNGTGIRYDYQGVPPDVYAAFQKADSKGRFVHAEIRGRYSVETVDTTAAPADAEA